MNYWKETRPTRSKEDTIGQHSHVADDDDGDNDGDDDGDDDDNDDIFCSFSPVSFSLHLPRPR